MLNTAFDELTPVKTDFYPETLRQEIDQINERVYHNINNGVYRAGFATAQDAYEEAYTALFAELDALDAHLANKRYLLGDALRDAFDIRLRGGVGHG